MHPMAEKSLKKKRMTEKPNLKKPGNFWKIIFFTEKSS